MRTASPCISYTSRDCRRCPRLAARRRCRFRPCSSRRSSSRPCRRPSTRSHRLHMRRTRESEEATTRRAVSSCACAPTIPTKLLRHATISRKGCSRLAREQEHQETDQRHERDDLDPVELAVVLYRALENGIGRGDEED